MCNDYSYYYPLPGRIDGCLESDAQTINPPEIRGIFSIKRKEMTKVLENSTLLTDLRVANSSWDTYSELTSRWNESYRPRVTEARLGVVATRLATFRQTGRHEVLTIDETDQPGGNFKFNGMAAVVDATLKNNPDVERFYIFSAGNAGAALVASISERNKRATLAGEHNKSVIVDTPRTLVLSKRNQLTGPNSTIYAVHDSIETAKVVSEMRAKNDDAGVFIHAYDNIDAIAGQGMVAHRAIQGLLARHQEGSLDITKDRITFLLQRGGGSLLTAFACAVQELKSRGIGGDNLQVVEVRPKESHERYDGLHVNEPGSYAKTVLDDPGFVQGTVHVSDVDTGRAMLDAHRRFGKQYEPSGLAGLAAVNSIWNSLPPTTFVTVLSGANSSPEAYKHFTGAPGCNQRAVLAGLESRSLKEVLQQQYDPYAEWQPTPHYYGRTPARRP
jgi:threonine dehydratase